MIFRSSFHCMRLDATRSNGQSHQADRSDQMCAHRVKGSGSFRSKGITGSDTINFHAITRNNAITITGQTITETITWSDTINFHIHWRRPERLRFRRIRAGLGFDDGVHGIMGSDTIKFAE